MSMDWTHRGAIAAVAYYVLFGMITDNRFHLSFTTYVHVLVIRQRQQCTAEVVDKIFCLEITRSEGGFGQ